MAETAGYQLWQGRTAAISYDRDVLPKISYGRDVLPEIGHIPNEQHCPSANHGLRS